MSFTYPVLTDEQIQSMNLVDDGEYDFEVVSATEKMSKAGNNQIEINIKIWDNKGVQRSLRDYLVATENMAYKVKHFCESTGLEYGKGNMDTFQLIGRSGKCIVIKQQGQEKPMGGRYPDKSVIKDYIKIGEGSSTVSSPKPVTAPAFNDDLPF